MLVWINSRRTGNQRDSRSTLCKICYANPVVSRCHGVFLSFCACNRYVGSPPLWVGTLGTIHKRTQMNPEEKREFYKSLNERVKQLRMSHLFEEPCPLYEPDYEEGDDWWDCRMQTDYHDDEDGEPRIFV